MHYIIRLEKFDKNYYSNLISWIDSKETLMQFAGPDFTFPLTSDQIEKSLNDTNRYAFKAVDVIKNEFIGYAEIYLTEKSIYLARILIGDKQHRGKGIGQKIVNLLLEHAFINFAQQQVELNVFDWNSSAIKCYENAGFTINPCRRFERKINDETWIAVNMTLSKIEWEKNRKRF